MTFNVIAVRPATLLENERPTVKGSHSSHWFFMSLLGAANGALYFLIMFFSISLARDYVQRQYAKEVAMLGAPIVQFGSYERWSGIAIALILLFAFAAYALNRFWQGRLGSLLFWLLVGVIAVTGWNVFMLTVTWFEKELSAQTMTYEWVTSRSNWLYGPVSLGMALFTNFIYGGLIRLFEGIKAVGPR